MLINVAYFGKPATELPMTKVVKYVPDHQTCYSCMLQAVLNILIMSRLSITITKENSVVVSVSYGFLFFQALAEGLKDNKTLKCLNLESNYVSGEGLKAILDAVNKPQTLTELRVANQVRDGFQNFGFQHYLFRGGCRIFPGGGGSTSKLTSKKGYNAVPISILQTPHPTPDTHLSGNCQTP